MLTQTLSRQLRPENDAANHNPFSANLIGGAIAAVMTRQVFEVAFALALGTPSYLNPAYPLLFVLPREIAGIYAFHRFGPQISKMISEKAITFKVRNFMNKKVLPPINQFFKNIQEKYLNEDMNDTINVQSPTVIEAPATTTDPKIKSLPARVKNLLKKNHDVKVSKQDIITLLKLTTQRLDAFNAIEAPAQQIVVEKLAEQLAKPVIEGLASADNSTSADPLLFSEENSRQVSTQKYQTTSNVSSEIEEKLQSNTLTM